MKSPLKDLQSLSLGRCSLRLNQPNEEEFDVLFCDDFAKPIGRVDSGETFKQSEQYDAVATQLQEWNVFASFDPVNETSMSSTAPLLLRKRVNFATDENGDVLCAEYECDKTHDVRESWYGSADFRQFRAWCHDAAACAILDMDYQEYFHMIYSACSRDKGIPVVDVDDAMAFAGYRGLERVVFRNELQADKLESIQNVVWTQNNAMLASEATLADTSRKLTATARSIALYLAAADSVIAQNTPDSERRFVEI